MKARAYAKVNLGLAIVGKEGEYHLIDTLMQSLALCDVVTVKKRHDGIITSNIAGDNSVTALQVLSDKFALGGFSVHIKKRIPYGGGLGGSTADVAAAVNCVIKLCGLDKTEAYNAVIPLFSDLAFMLEGGTARCTGRGEKVQKLAPLPRCYALLCLPQSGVDTAKAYTLSDDTPTGGADIEKLYGALLKQQSAKQFYANDLFQAAATINAEVATCAEKMQDEKALLCGMSGSGSTLFNLYAKRRDAAKKAKKTGSRTVITHTRGQY